jgi:phage-related protein
MEVRIHKKAMEFIQALETPLYAEAEHLVDLLREYGHRIRLHYSRFLGHGIFELRGRGRQALRLLYGYRDDGAVVVLGFVKMTAAAPRRYLDEAAARMATLDRQ